MCGYLNYWQLDLTQTDITEKQDFGDAFDKVIVSRLRSSSLSNMPKGAIVVWNKKAGASQYGHTAISLGGGKEASDHVRNIIIDTSNRYGPYRVFFPTGNSTIALGTEGNFAISGSYSALEDFYSKLKDILKNNNGNVKLEYKKG